MVLWRISNHVSLTGDGGLRASARWHTRGRRIVYCSETPSAALLEILVHLEVAVGDLPVHFRLIRITAPDDLRPETVLPGSLPPDWTITPSVTQALGNAWLEASGSALLVVPSAIVPETFNVLLNPSHPDASRVVVVSSTDHPLDRRLL